jgi:hypothetical protein
MSKIHLLPQLPGLRRVIIHRHAIDAPRGHQLTDFGVGREQAGAVFRMRPPSAPQPYMQPS